MKIRLSMQDYSVVANVKENEAPGLFRQLSMAVLGIAPGNESIPKVIAEVPAPPMPGKIKPPQGATGHKGFLYIKCPHCGAYKGMCAKEPMTYFKCSICEQKSDLGANLRDLTLDCECGKRFRYKTNLTEKMLDIECIDCGNLVPILYNEKKDVYETITRA